MIEYVTPPSTFPITRNEAKQECRIELDDTSHDADLDLYLAAATHYCQKRSRRQFVTATLKQTVRPFCSFVGIDRTPLVSITSVKDGDGVDVTYELDKSRLRPHLILDRVPAKLEIVYVAGFGTTADIPANQKTALLKVTRHYWRRVDEPVPALIDALLDGVSWFS